ncbi:MAG: hypothetical protein ACE5JQ_08210 [Candidatus Methylomirabilales bacterium]
MRAPILLVGFAFLVYASAPTTAGDVATAEAPGELGVGAGNVEETESSHVGDVEPETS